MTSTLCNMLVSIHPMSIPSITKLDNKILLFCNILIYNSFIPSPSCNGDNISGIDGYGRLKTR